MSATLKLIIGLITVMLVGALYALKQNEASFEANLSPHQTLQTMMTTGQVEVKTFHDWCKSQGHKGQDLEKCVQKRKEKVKQLLELEKKSLEESKVEKASPEHLKKMD